MLAMGRVLMIQPAVFLLDEPTANLAPKVAAELLSGHVRALAEAGAAVLVVEQRAKAVLAISDYTYVLGGGQVLMADTPARLAASREFTESFFGVARSPRRRRASRPLVTAAMMTCGRTARGTVQCPRTTEASLRAHLVDEVERGLAARRKRVNPASAVICRMAASPAWAPRA